MTTPELNLKWQCIECREILDEPAVLFECDICGYLSVMHDEDDDSVFLPNRHCPECFEGQMHATHQMGCRMCFTGVTAQVGTLYCVHCGKEFAVTEGGCCRECQALGCDTSEHYPQDFLEDLAELTKATKNLEIIQPPVVPVKLETREAPAPGSKKYCKHCNAWLTMDRFSKSRSSKDGYRPYCKEYDRAASRRSQNKKLGR